MRAYKLTIIYLLGLALMSIALLANPNGREPPRTSALAVVKATCDARAANIGHEVLRARIVDAKGLSQTLTVRMGAAIEQVAVYDIKTVTLASDAVDGSGFTKATVTLASDEKEVPAMVRVRSESGALRLIGFKADGSSIQVDLQDCKKISFTPQRRGEPTSRPARAKD